GGNGRRHVTLDRVRQQVMQLIDDLAFAPAVAGLLATPGDVRQVPVAMDGDAGGVRFEAMSGGELFDLAKDRARRRDAEIPQVGRNRSRIEIESQSPAAAPRLALPPQSHNPP